MSFVLKKIPDITVPVSVVVPGEEAPATLYATWRLHPVSETQKIMEKQRAGEMDDEALVDQDLVGLSGITDEDTSGDDIINWGAKIGAKYSF